MAPRNQPFGKRVKLLWRSRGERVRLAFVVVRHLRHPLRFAASRRAARAQRPAPAIAVASDQGFRIFPVGTFPEASEVAALAKELLARVGNDPSGARHKAAQGAGRKEFLVNLLDPLTLDGSHPAVRLALRPDVLAAVAAYMGTVPVLRSIQVFYSGTLEREPVSSQLYHCDADDTRQMKLFVLCSEVGRANGPLTLLDAKRSAAVRRATHYTYHERLSDDTVASVLGGTAEPAELIGPPGTACLVDTSGCFHFGSRVEPGAAPRLVTMIQFLSPHAFVLRGDYRTGAAVAWRGDATLNPLQRAVLTGDQSHLRATGRGHHRGE